MAPRSWGICEKVAICHASATPLQRIAMPKSLSVWQDTCNRQAGLRFTGHANARHGFSWLTGREAPDLCPTGAGAEILRTCARAQRRFPKFWDLHHFHRFQRHSLEFEAWLSSDNTPLCLYCAVTEHRRTWVNARSSRFGAPKASLPIELQRPGLSNKFRAGFRMSAALSLAAGEHTSPMPKPWR